MLAQLLEVGHRIRRATVDVGGDALVEGRRENVFRRILGDHDDWDRPPQTVQSPDHARYVVVLRMIEDDRVYRAVAQSCDGILDRSLRHHLDGRILERYEFLGQDQESWIRAYQEHVVHRRTSWPMRPRYEECLWAHNDDVSSDSAQAGSSVRMPPFPSDLYGWMICP